MLTAKFFLAVVIMFILITFIQWFFVGFLFHKYQRKTPATWRKETTKSYAYSMVLTIMFSFLFAFIVHSWKSRYGEMNIWDAVKFALVFWVAFSLLSEVGSAVYVNFSRMFVVGRCLSSLFEFAAAAIIAAWLA